ncbi:MAG: aminodeoxychorismate/anthranilate synthase component II [Euryarchaeota archaeon]|nr:aminodeoxychorismate/anthranilate synthase component II [Euryarchaeota archaeon]
MNILLLDNYDSFVYNLKDVLEGLGANTAVVRNDAIDIEGVRRLDPDAIVLSPGPGLPSCRRDFGICGDVLTSISHEVPTLGVCLGHQGIAQFHGGEIRAAELLIHGKRSMIYHRGTGLYDGLPIPFPAGRYHSFVVSPHLPSCLEVTSHTADGVIMGIRHRSLPIEGVQFHPESVLTPDGHRLMANFLKGLRR